MSESQCYEFVALDRPLTSAELAELRSISTVLHELGSSRADYRHLLGLGDHSADRWTQIRGDIREGTKTGDLTYVLEHLLHQLQGRLEHLLGRLKEYSSRERSEPWLTVSPPDDLDRRIFSMVQSTAARSPCTTGARADSSSPIAPSSRASASSGSFWPSNTGSGLDRAEHVGLARVGRLLARATSLWPVTT